MFSNKRISLYKLKQEAILSEGTKPRYFHLMKYAKCKISHLPNIKKLIRLYDSLNTRTTNQHKLQIVASRLTTGETNPVN